jgi:hypothetical protein
MKKLNKLQFIGIGILLFGIIIPFLVENNVVETIAGVFAAIGIGFILKWIPFKKQKA